MSMLTRTEEAEESHLASSQPESAGKYATFLETLRGRVLKTALANKQVQKRLAGVRHRLLAIDFHQEKHAAGMIRLAAVGFYDYDRDTLVVASINLHDSSLAGLDDHPGAAPPISGEELTEARQIAATAPGAGEALGAGAAVVAFPAPSYTFAPNSPRVGHRGCLLYVSEEKAGTSLVTVDLSAREVVPGQDLSEDFQAHIMPPR